MSAVIAEFQPPQRHLAIVPAPQARATGSDGLEMHITRRGRVARTIALLVTVAALVMAALTLVSPASAAIEVEVQPGQTLSEIAAAHLPSLPLDRAIVTVQLENDMNSAQVQVGQRLVIP